MECINHKDGLSSGWSGFSSPHCFLRSLAIMMAEADLLTRMLASLSWQALLRHGELVLLQACDTIYRSEWGVVPLVSLSAVVSLSVGSLATKTASRCRQRGPSPARPILLRPASWWAWAARCPQSKLAIPESRVVGVDRFSPCPKRGSYGFDLEVRGRCAAPVCNHTSGREANCPGSWEPAPDAEPPVFFFFGADVLAPAICTLAVGLGVLGFFELDASLPL